MPHTQELADLLNDLIENDPLINSDDIAVNVGLNGELVVYWARKPSRRKRNRYKRLLRRAKRSLE